MFKYRYHVLGHCTYTFSSRVEQLQPGWVCIGATPYQILQRITEDAVQDYLDNHGGEDKVWPLTFILFDTNCNELGRFPIRQETRYFVEESPEAIRQYEMAAAKWYEI